MAVVESDRNGPMGVDGVVVVVEDVVGKDQDLGSGYDSYELANLSRIQLSLILLCSTILLKNQILIKRCVYIGLVVNNLKLRCVYIGSYEDILPLNFIMGFYVTQVSSFNFAMLDRLLS